MRCTSFTPVYYHARDLNVGASGYSWHLYDSNASCGDERGYNVSMPPCDQFSVYDKEVLKQIILNHESTFRYQVQELHRLYRRQRDLMDETRMRDIYTYHLLSRISESVQSLAHAGSDFPQNRSPATNWLLGNLASSKLSELASGDMQVHKSVVADKLEEPATLCTDFFRRKNSMNNVQFLSPSCERSGNEIVSLELAADMYNGDQRKQFKVVKLSDAPESKCRTPQEIPNFLPSSDSDSVSIKAWDFSSSSLNIRKTNCFIDLNVPVELESLPASSSGTFEACTGHNKTACSDECLPVEAIPESMVPTQSQLLKSDDSSPDGINSSMAIDLNSMPVNYFTETKMALESPRSINREANVVLDCSSTCHPPLRNRKCCEHEHVVHNTISDNFLKAEPYINLNTGVVDEHSLPLSSSTLQIKSAEDTELKGPVSPENEESSPPRGRSEDIQLEAPLSSEQGGGEPFIEVDIIAAQTLVNMGAAMLDSLAKFRNLCWFAEFVSSSGDDLEDEGMEFENDQVEENALNLLHFNKAKGTGTMSRKSGKGQKKGKKRPKDFRKEEALGSQGCLKTGQLKRKAGKNVCAKTRKYSKLSPSEVTKKSMSLILKQSVAHMDQGVVQSWGKIRKRQGGRRRRASNSFSLAELGSF